MDFIKKITTSLLFIIIDLPTGKNSKNIMHLNLEV